MKKKLKVILHHDVSDQVMIDRHFSLGQFLKRLLFGLINGAATALYYIGLSIISLPKIPKLVISFFSEKNWRLKFNKSLSFIIMIAIASAPIVVFKTASEGQRLTGRVLGISQDAIGEIGSAKDAISAQDYSLAQANFKTALEQLKLAQSELDQSSLVLQSIVKLSPDSYSSEHVLQAAQLLTESAVIGSELLGLVENLKFSPEGLAYNHDSRVSEVIVSVRDNCIKISDKLKRANELLAPLNADVLPAQYQSVLKDSQALVASLSAQTESLGLLGQLFADLMLGEKRFLVVLQNNNEIRGSGGFIGTIGQGKINDGSIQALDIRTVYDPDGQLQEWVKPPFQQQAVNNRLYLRDSNWFASFPDSAKSISHSYERTGGETPDLVIAITPDLFIEMLDLTGPITLPTYDVTISAANFVEQVQTSTSVYYDKNLNQPKQLLADLYPALMQRVAEVTKSDPLELMGVLQTNLDKKNIQLYSRNENLQSQFERFNWAGKINFTDRDYLHINFSNLGGTKTDRSLIRKVSLDTTIDNDGVTINQVSYEVTNPMPNNPALGNRSFVRVLVPLGSQLLAAGGFYKLEVPALDQNQTYYDDSLISVWNSSLNYVDKHKIWTGIEANKTMFGGWLDIAGRETKTVTFTYLLPYKISSVDRYSLLVEKQSGVLPYEFRQQINFSGRTKVWDNITTNSRSIQNQNDSALTWTTNLETDNFIGLVLEDKD